jgi:acyl-CoA dehydrogenase
VLDGEKTWISNGGIADHLHRVRPHRRGAGRQGACRPSCADADTPGLKLPSGWKPSRRIPWRGCASTMCRVPPMPDRRAGRGLRIAMAVLDVFRSTVGAAALGFARRALDETLARVRDRSCSARRWPICRWCRAPRRHGAGCRCRRAAGLPRRLDQGQGAARVTREAAMAKLYATEAAQR